MVRKRYEGNDDDRLGFDDTKNYLTAAVAKIVPNALARRAIEIRVSTDKQSYEPGEVVEIEIELHNRLPVPVRVPTPRQRRWGWEIDGLVEATDEKRYVADTPSTFQFRAGERKRTVVEWNGHFRRTSGTGMDVSEVAERGDHRITAYLATDSPGNRPEDSTTIRIQ